MTGREYFVYRAFDQAGRLLYIGCTKDPKRRWQTHRQDGYWAPFAARFRVTGPLVRETALRIERAAQVAESPLFGATPQRWSTGDYSLANHLRAYLELVSA